MKRIDIGTVLNKFDDTVTPNLKVKSYGIRFLNSRGEKRELVCSKNTKNPKAGISGNEKRGKVQFNLKRNGVMMVQAVGETNPRTIKTAMIYGFRDFNSDLWYDVFH